jgi:hyaluronan synthase
VLVLIPSYKEEYSVAKATIDACLAATMHLPVGSEFLVVHIEDNSENAVVAQLRQDFEGIESVLIECCGENMGKREAQAHGFYAANFAPDFVITIDSDTIVNQYAFLSLLSQMRPGTGAVTGNITIAKPEQGNLIQKLISLRYWNAFNFERAAQSLFGDVLCCSGPLTCYRGDLFSKALPAYTSQTFRGHRCTFGDDRHMTSLILAQGFDTRYDYRAVAFTAAPSTIREYIKQQTRWNRSAYRESLLMFRNGSLTRHGRPRIYAIWEVLITIVLPVMLAANLGMMAVSHWQNIGVLAQYFAVLITVAYIRSIIGLQNDPFNRRRWYVLFPLYALFNVIVMLPIRFWAAYTVNEKSWGTR